MKYKVLVTGKNKAIIDDFFFHIDFESQSTSRRYDDVVSHVKYFEPNAFVYCIKNEEKDDITRMVSLKELFRKKDIIFVIIGEQEDCANFEKMAYNIADLVLTRPITTTGIQEAIEHHLHEKEREKMLAEAENALAQAKKIAEQEELEQAANRKHILVIDDDARMLKTVKGHLKDEYDVATAINGRLARKFLENKTTDLILLDYQMPEETGPEVFKKLKENVATKNIPVIFLTGVDDLSKVQEVLKLKPQGYLLKPIDHDKLVSTIQDVIG